MTDPMPDTISQEELRKRLEGMDFITKVRKQSMPMAQKVGPRAARLIAAAVFAGNKRVYLEEQ